MPNVEWDDTNVIQHLKKLADNLTPSILAIGEDLLESTKKRFSTKTAPDGTTWKPNSPVTINTTHKNPGGTWQKGVDDPLIGQDKQLSTAIQYELSGGDTLKIGSNKNYAAMQQFGGAKSEFPHLWGDIPARPFLGISLDDESNILNVIEQYLSS